MNIKNEISIWQSALYKSVYIKSFIYLYCYTEYRSYYTLCYILMINVCKGCNVAWQYALMVHRTSHHSLIFNLKKKTPGLLHFKNNIHIFLRKNSIIFQRANHYSKLRLHEQKQHELFTAKTWLKFYSKWWKNKYIKIVKL